jgi:hypothetical protein
MASGNYIRKKKERARAKSLKGVEARRRKRIAEASEMEVVGTMITSGAFGEHTIEILDGSNGSDLDDAFVVYIRVDGCLRRPRSADGVKRVVAGWIFKQALKLQ